MYERIDQEPKTSINNQFEDWIEDRGLHKTRKDLKEKLYYTWLESAIRQIKLSEHKKKIIETLSYKWISMSDVVSLTGMSKALISYHIRGTEKYDGLWTYGFVRTKTVGNQMFMILTDEGEYLKDRLK